MPAGGVHRASPHIWPSSGLPVRIAGLEAEKLLGHMARDKKMRGGKLTFVLSRGIGRAFTSSDVPAEAVRATLLANGAV